MTSKFTIRDFLVYTFVGLTAGILVYFHKTENANEILKSVSEFSNFATIIFIPIFYLVGHLVMGIDDILFNRILTIPIRNVKFKGANWFWKTYNFVLFGYRNQGLKWVKSIEKKDFLKKCDILIEKSIYSKPEYFQVMSDLFKGIFLSLLVSMLVDFNFWKLGILFIVWYRARMFSAYYVNMVLRNTEQR